MIDICRDAPCTVSISTCFAGQPRTWTEFSAERTELPVRVPFKYEMTVNLKTAKALGLAVPLSLQQIADEVIE